jgi:hypothetical protein
MARIIDVAIMARAMGRSKIAVRRLCQRGAIPVAFKFRSRWVAYESEFEAWLAKLRRP